MLVILKSAQVRMLNSNENKSPLQILIWVGRDSRLLDEIWSKIFSKLIYAPHRYWSGNKNTLERLCITIKDKAIAKLTYPD
uniref:Uncharacterized protein n=1 Tax=Rhizophora mucronata TaxID=61149 RepID=A0A2P2IL44_RHIMU